MDPCTWGPILWKVIFDICWNMNNVELNKNQKFAIKVFFNSLQYLLPCKYCRESYCKYLKELGELPMLASSQGIQKQHDYKSLQWASLKWAFDLKNKVNDKLNKQDRISFEKVVQRMKTYQSCASQADVLDFLFIVGVNYMSDLDNPFAHKRKKAWFWLMIKTVPFVLELLPQQHQLAKAFFEKPAVQADVQTKDTVISYLCQVSQQIDGRLRKVDKMCKKYLNAQSLTKNMTLISPR